MAFRVMPYRLPVIEHPSCRAPLYPHQVAMWDGWEEHKTVLLSAKTGAGKTRAVMLPLLKRRESGVAVYPTNELLRDQVKAVARFAQEEGLNPLIWTPRKMSIGEREEYSRADCILVPIDGGLLDDWQRAMPCRSRGEALRRLLDPDKPKIVFTNPDVLFLILGLHYHAGPLEALRRYQTLVADEFHLYQGVELAHALVMVALARGLGIFRRLVLLSATPDPEVAAMLERALKPTVIQGDGGAEGITGPWRVAVHGVEVRPIELTGGDPVETMVSEVVSLKGELERLRKETPEDDYLPAVVVVNSVVNAIRLEDRLVEAGFPRDCLAVIRGLSNRAIRDTKGKLLALGTSAIEVGVDFRCDYLLFEASEAASFLQRFGRVGRHRPGTAIALVPPNAFQGMMKLPTEIDRAGFEERIHAWYPSASARPWFVTTKHGMITVRTVGENLIATVAKDAGARPGLLTELRGRIEEVLADHAERLGCAAQNVQAKQAFERCSAGKPGAKWIETYRRLARFRSSLPTLRVHDFAEQHRRQDWELGEYEADLKTLLKRAVGISWDEKLGMLTIRGIGRYRRVHASEVFGEDDCGCILQTEDFPQLRLYQDDESTPVSDLLSRENHIFTVVRKSLLADWVDWRLPVFEAGNYMLALDGSALLVLEIAGRGRNNQEMR
jgi:CRISPR-associated endonuclease/helicase Cas3